MNSRAWKNFHFLRIPLILLVIMGCASKDDRFGAEIRKTLGVTRDTLEKTQDSPERNYDPKVILMRAEAYYRKKEYVEAGVEYERFLDLHPLHDWASYALFKLGLSHFRQMRNIDRDQEPTRKALESFQKFLSVHPDSEYSPDALEMLNLSKKALAQNDFYIGRFYFKKGSYDAAIDRFQNLIETYPDSVESGDALYYLARSHLRQSESKEALRYLEDFLSRYPGSPYRESAQKLRQRINRASHQ